MEKRRLVRYDTEAAFEYAEGCLRFYLPTKSGFINYNIVHSVRREITADIWRLGQAFGYDGDLSGEYKLTPFGAEWDMAVMLEGRDDFIGGSNHGDEIFTSIDVIIDGRSTELSSLAKLTDFESATVKVSSVGYDPNDHKSVALLHYKEYSVTERGVTVSQRIEWQRDFSVGSSYLAMMPPMKTLTEVYMTDNHPAAKPIVNGTVVTGARSATLSGINSGMKFTMSIEKYPDLLPETRFLITDNSGNAYNKMYFFAAKGNEVKRGEIWESVTSYSITPV